MNVKNITLHFRHKFLNGQVVLPASKSISNRVLILHALAGSEFPIENLSDCDDTCSVKKVLSSEAHYFDVGHAGTAMRFLTAFLARIPGVWEITGSERMKQRPIGVLVEALNRLGACVEYTEKSGYPPLRIAGAVLQGGEIQLPASVSSQYISALMMIAPYMEKGLKIDLQGKIVSAAYIDMTLALMKVFGAEANREGSCIEIHPVAYTPVPYRVEPDWSAASYFYELLALAEGGEIRLPGLQKESLQGDARQTELWKKLGVVTDFYSDEVVLTKGQPEITYWEQDFTEMPDLVQSFAVACCMLNIPFVFSGVETLRIKETDRIEALVAELAKLGYGLKAEGDNRLLWKGEKGQPREAVEITTYHDHRMAMAFAPAALKHPGITIVDKNVVTKSFPCYWEELFRCTGDT